MQGSIKAFLDEEGRVTRLPAKRAMRVAVLAYLFGKFEEQEYNEKQVNAIIDTWHTFGDYFLIRRELVDEGFLQRVPDGSRYWRNPDAPVVPHSL